MSQTYIVSAKRTAIGRFGESLRVVPARTLASIAIGAAVKQSGLASEAIEEVVMGHVIQAGANFVARNAAVDAGIPYASPASTVNQACASGMVAIAAADRAIRLGDRNIMVAGGVESMSSAPYISRSTRWGNKYGDTSLTDELACSLTCSLTDLAMGQTAENIARRYGITRQEQDEWAVRSHVSALAAIESGRFSEEIVSVPIPQRKGDPVMFQTDEHPRATSLDQLSKLKPAFATDGTVTAGNSSGINDGAAALVLASETAVEQYSLSPLARIVATASTGIEPEIMGLGPVLAIEQVLAKAQLKIEDIDFFEINEAFAAQILGVLRETLIPIEKLNVNGSGIALGHPIGCTGARIVTTLIYELRRRGCRYGLASLCVGGGMGAAIVVEACRETHRPR